MINLVTGYKDTYKSVGGDEPRPCARAPAPLARLRLARSAPRARVSAGKWALRAHFPAPKQITSVKRDEPERNEPRNCKTVKSTKIFSTTLTKQISW